MKNLIVNQKGKSIGQITYEYNTEVLDEPIRRQNNGYSLKQLVFRKKEI
jgi:hypothetical protein